MENLQGRLDKLKNLLLLFANFEDAIQEIGREIRIMRDSIPEEIPIDDVPKILEADEKRKKLLQEKENLKKEQLQIASEIQKVIEDMPDNFKKLIKHRPLVIFNENKDKLVFKFEFIQNENLNEIKYQKYPF